MKRVLIFSLAYYPHIGGAEIAIKEITDRISDMEFHMLTLNLGNEVTDEKIGNIFVHRLGNGSSYFSKILFIPRAAYAARLMHRVYDFDFFWAMMSYMSLPIVLLRFIGVRTPYIITLQEGDPFKHMFNRWFILPFRPLLSIGFRKASAIQSISSYLTIWAKRMGFKDKVTIIGNGVDIARFVQMHIRPLTEKDVILVTTSRLVHKNAIDDVIRALVLLPEQIRFRIYGVGKEERNLVKLAEHLGVSPRIEFNGFIEHEKLPAVLQECDIFVRPSRSEGMGNSFIEAMAAGLPVIATQEGGIADFLFDARRNPRERTTGWAVDKDSPEQIALAVKDILAHPEQVARVKEEAKKLVSEKYDWNIVSRKMKTLFESLLDKR